MGRVNLTARAVAYLASEEGLVLEAYKDVKGIWTWALGVATPSGFPVLQYKDSPAPLEECLRVSIDLLKKQYLPAVQRAFKTDLTEAQTAAALGFHWNTGAIEKAQWVKDVNAGELDRASGNILQWSSHGLLTQRRLREQRLFFKDNWPADIRCNVYPVNRSNYHPVTSKGVRTDLLPTLSKIVG
jgi:GH24 family phage-related lysozyme (muramidase)